MLSILFQVYDYLVKTPACNQTRESICEFIEKSKEYQLAKAEVLNIINIRPSSAVEIVPVNLKPFNDLILHMLALPCTCVFFCFQIALIIFDFAFSLFAIDLFSTHLPEIAFTDITLMDCLKQSLCLQGVGGPTCGYLKAPHWWVILS